MSKFSLSAMIPAILPFIMSSIRHGLTAFGVWIVALATMHPLAKSLLDASGLSGDQIIAAIVGVGVALAGYVLSLINSYKLPTTTTE